MRFWWDGEDEDIHREEARRVRLAMPLPRSHAADRVLAGCLGLAEALLWVALAAAMITNWTH